MDPNYEGMARARQMCLKNINRGVDSLRPHISRDEVLVTLDSTSAYANADNFRKLAGLRPR